MTSRRECEALVEGIEGAELRIGLVREPFEVDPAERVVGAVDAARPRPSPATRRDLRRHAGWMPRSPRPPASPPWCSARAARAPTRSRSGWTSRASSLRRGARRGGARAAARDRVDRETRCATAAPDGADDRSPLGFHRALPGYAPTPLIDAPELADEWGVGRVLLKFERERFGLPAFKFLGASWAAHRLLGDPPHDPGSSWWPPPTATTAARWPASPRCAGLGATILVPAGTVARPDRRDRGRGRRRSRWWTAPTTTPCGAARRWPGERRLVLSDTSWPGYEEVPSWVIEGYATIFQEIDEQAGGAPLDVAVVPIGVGALAAAAARAPRRPRPARRASSRDGAACMLESVARRPDHRGARTARARSWPG